VRLNNLQIGKIGEMELVKHIIVGSEGQLNAFVPVAPDDKRDVEVCLRQGFEPGIAIQSKVRTQARRDLLDPLDFGWVVSPDRLVDDTRFFYFFAHLDLKACRLSELVLLVPSTVVHADVRMLDSEGLRGFRLFASLHPLYRDRWSPYRVPLGDLGQRVVEIIRELNAGRVRPASLIAA
jgi:hypothetical protein